MFLQVLIGYILKFGCFTRAEPQIGRELAGPIIQIIQRYEPRSREAMSRKEVVV